MKLLITFLLTFTLIISASATCPDHLRLQKGDSAPCKGHFFNDEMEKSIRKDVRDNEIREQKIELKNLQINQLKEDRNRWKEEAEHQAEVRHEMDGDLTKGLIYGVSLTLAVLFGASKVVD